MPSSSAEGTTASSPPPCSPRRDARSPCSRRGPVVGGAAVTEQPWGPEFKVTALSYVMSLMPDAIVNGLDLARHGYHVYPMGPSYLGLPDGRGLVMSEDEADRYTSIGGASQARRRSPSSAGTRGWAASPTCSDRCSPRCRRSWARSGRPTCSTRPRLAWRLRGLDVRKASDVTRLFTMSVGDLLREWFESEAVQAMMAVNGVIGTWAGPEEPGTAYVMLHHSIGDVGAGSALGQWGYPDGGMGAVADAIRRAAESHGASCGRTPRSSGCSPARPGDRRGAGRRRGAARRDVVVDGRAPADRLPPPPRRRRAAGRLRGRASAAGAAGAAPSRSTSRCPSCPTSPPTRGPTLQPHHTGAIELAHSLDYLEPRSRTPGAGGRRPGPSATGASRRRSTRRSAPRARTS